MICVVGPPTTVLEWVLRRPSSQRASNERLVSVFRQVCGASREIEGTAGSTVSIARTSGAFPLTVKVSPIALAANDHN